MKDKMSKAMIAFEKFTKIQMKALMSEAVIVKRRLIHTVKVYEGETIKETENN